MTDARQATIAQRFLDAATAAPDQPALIFPDASFSYGQLQALVAAFALRFRAAGLDGSGAIAVRSDDPAVALPAVLAAALLGIPVNAGPNRADPSEVLITTKAPAGDLPHLLVDHSFSPAVFDAAEREAIWAKASPDADRPWLNCPRSFEAGTAPILALGQGRIVQRALHFGPMLSGPRPRVAVLVPPTGYHGLVRRLATLFHGGCLLEAGPWDFLTRNGATDVILPAAGVAGLRAIAAEGGSGLRCEVLGLRLAPGDREALLHSFREVAVTLDLAETGPVLTTVAAAQDRGVEARQVQWARTRIAALSGAPAEVGRLGIAADTAAEDWLWPGIAARQGGQGPEILGIASGRETILVGGQELDAAVLDAVITATEGIVDAVAFASPKPGQDEILCLALFEEGVNRHHVVKRVETACRDAFGPVAVPAKIRPVAAVPRLPGGQPDRRACAEMILQAARS